jgi:type IV pilus assembly protein PilE
LATIAVPSYQSSVIRSHRLIAQGILTDTSARQAQYFVNNKAYATNLEELGLPDPYYVNANADVTSEADAIYEIVLVTDSGNWDGFAAEPFNSQANDTQCATLSLSRTGDKGASGSDPSRCW